MADTILMCAYVLNFLIAAALMIGFGSQSLSLKVAGIDTKVFEIIPEPLKTNELKKYVRLGRMILVSVAFAGIGAGFACFTLFSGALGESLIAADVWMGFIFVLETFLIGLSTGAPKSRFLLGFRLLLALAIAMVVTNFLEIKIFEPEINNIVSETHSQQIKSSTEELDAEYGSRTAVLLQSPVKVQIGEQTALCREKNKSFLGEVDGTSGSGRKGYSKIALVKEADWKLCERSLKALTQSKENQMVDTEIDSLKKEKELRMSERVAAIQTDNGLIQRMKALHTVLLTADWLTKVKVLSLMVIFILLECSPIFGKTFYFDNHYEHLQRAARQLRETKTNNGLRVAEAKDTDQATIKVMRSNDAVYHEARNMSESRRMPVFQAGTVDELDENINKNGAGGVYSKSFKGDISNN